MIDSALHRLAGLKYIQTCLDVGMHGPLVIQGLVNSFNDSKILVKRQALDIAKQYFGFLNPSLSKKMMIDLMRGAFKLFQNRDMTLTRRLWDWIYPDDCSQSKWIASALAQVIDQYTI